MHDPLTVAFEIPRPWPRRFKARTINGRTTPAERYWPSMVTVWHRDPSGHDNGACPIYPGNAWRWHVHHWRIQIPALQEMRRRLLTRCDWCGGRSTKTDPTNVSNSWDGPRGRWWQGEPGLSHMDCSDIARAHACCVCETPVLEYDSYGRCAQCSGFRPFEMSEENLARMRELAAIPAGGRNV